LFKTFYPAKKGATISMNLKRRLTLLFFVFMAILLSGCATKTVRSDYDNDCDYARAYHQEMQTSVRTYYALGTTSVAEIAIAERRLKRAAEEMKKACGE
jgi:hypothetical protein